MHRQTRKNRVRRASQPPEPPRFTVGRDPHGWWVVEDRLGRVGGLFASEEAAMHYALEESNRDRKAVRRQQIGAAIAFRFA